MAISKKEQDKLVFMTKRDAQGNIIVTRASGNNGGEIRGSILRTNEGNPYLVAGKGISILSGSNSGYPQAGQVTLEVDLGSITDELKSVIVTSGLSGLVGPQGTPGAAGAAGSTGSEGTAGTDGEQGEQGEQGIGITSIDFNDDATLRIVYGDEDDIVDTGSLLGPQGVGISTIEINIPEDSDNEAYLIFTLDINDEDGIPVTIELPENIKGPRGIGFEAGDAFSTRATFPTTPQTGATVIFDGMELTEHLEYAVGRTSADQDDLDVDEYGHDHGELAPSDIHMHKVNSYKNLPRGITGDSRLTSHLFVNPDWVPITGTTALPPHAEQSIQNMSKELSLYVIGEYVVLPPYSTGWGGYDPMAEQFDLATIVDSYMSFKVQRFTSGLGWVDLEYLDPDGLSHTLQVTQTLVANSGYGSSWENDFPLGDGSAAFVLDDDGADLYGSLGTIATDLRFSDDPEPYAQYMRPFAADTSWALDEVFDGHPDYGITNKWLRVVAQINIGGLLIDSDDWDTIDNINDWATWDFDANPLVNFNGSAGPGIDDDGALANWLFATYASPLRHMVWVHIHDVFFDIKYTVPDE